MNNKITKTLAALVAVSFAIPMVAKAQHDLPLGPDFTPKIRQMISPLSGVPIFAEPGELIQVEIDAAQVSSDALSDAQVSLTPSFGSAIQTQNLQLVSLEQNQPSSIWHDRPVHIVTAEVPAFSESFIEDLYDVSIAWEGGADLQHRAAKIVAAIPTEPRFVVLADPSVGDPRPIQEGGEDVLNSQNYESLRRKTERTIGNPMNEGRWEALQVAIAEINQLNPDFVLVAGDLTFAVYPRPLNIEYEDAFRIMAQLQVPAFVSPGNHDLYNFGYDDLDRPHLTDGLELWQHYFAPLYWSRNIGSNVHLVSLNTFDWSAAEREPFDEDDEFSTRAGGQIGQEQLAWLEGDLDSYRSENPDGSIVTLAHHDPSWRAARHPWAGANRIEGREVMNDAGVGVHFAGHTHEDRVARYYDGSIAETNGRAGPNGMLQLLNPDNSLGDPAVWTQEILGNIISNPDNGTLFVTTTTVSSVLKGSDWGEGSYWGYRLGTLTRVRGGFDPISFGYPATQEFLNANAERPERWKAEHSIYGLYSFPSYHLTVTQEESETGPGVNVTAESLWLVGVTVDLDISLVGPEYANPTVQGGQLLRKRTVGDNTDLVVRVTVPAEGQVSVQVTPTP